MIKINVPALCAASAALLLLASCKKTDMMVYQQNAGVFFSQSAYSYTFVNDPTLTEKKLKLAVSISGLPVDYDRHFTIAHPANDTITTASPDQYEVGEGIVPAGEFTGTVDLTVKYDPSLDERIDTLRFEIVATEDFPEVRLNRSYATVAFTRMVIRPDNWNWLRWYFGTPYSTRWWLFILDVTGGNPLPYHGTLGSVDPETWPMSANEVKAWQTKVRLALEKYNREHPGEPLTHDDGDYAGTPVTMPD